MTLSQCPHLLLRRYADPVPSVEQFLISAQGDLPVPTDTDSQIEILTRQSKASTNYNQYIFSQYVMYLYVNIFMADTNSRIYNSLLQSTIVEIRTAWRNRITTDRSLNELIGKYIQDGGSSTVDSNYGRDFVDALRVVGGRLALEATYPGINDILAIVCAMYDDRAVNVPDVTLYRITLVQLDGYKTPTFVLTSIRSGFTLNTINNIKTTDLVWKLIGSMNIPSRIKIGGDFTQYLTCLAQLAIPLDPVALTTSLRYNLSSNEKSGVPFLNYLAMYFRQRALGFDYNLSRLADPRRLIMQQMHKFCGVGATVIYNNQYVINFLKEIDNIGESSNGNLFTESDTALYRQLNEAVTSQKLPFVRKLHYNASTEAAKVSDAPEDPDKSNPPDKPEKPVKPKKPKKPTEPADPDQPDEPDTGAFADDTDPTTNSTDDNSDTSQTSDDIIGQTGDTNQPVPPRPSSTLLPLALPSETIDDCLYRLAVLRFVSNLVNATDSDVTAKTINLLKVWCGSLLYIASADTTRTLVSQLKLTEKLKEYAA